MTYLLTSLILLYLNQSLLAAAFDSFNAVGCDTNDYKGGENIQIQGRSHRES